MASAGATTPTAGATTPTAGATTPTAGAATPTAGAPLSFPQESLWFLHGLGDSGAYNEIEGVRIRGPLDVDRLRQAFDEVLRRHEVLRTVYVATDGVVRQVPLPFEPVGLPVLDLSLLPAADRERHVAAIAHRDALQRFVLETGPMLRLKLLRLAPDEHVLTVTIHHLCGDGWSLGILSREVEAAYRALVSGQAPALPALKAQYGEYARWQRETLVGSRLADQVAYWRERLAQLPPLLDLPLDHSRPAVQGFEGAARTLDLGPDLTARLKAVGRRLRATPYMTTLAAFAVLLHRYSRMGEFAIGSPFANRGRSEFENLIGFFANTVVMRADLSGDPTVEELVARLRKTTLEAHEHAEVPFEKVVEAVQPVRDLSYNPIFQVMFSWQPGHTLANVVLPDLEVSPLGVTAGRAKFDLNLVMWDSADGICSRWEYNTALFEPGTVQRMTEHFRRLLARMVEDPSRRVSELDLLGDEERQSVLTRWLARADYPPGETIDQAFARQAAARPDAVAVSFAGQTLTYAELDDRSTALAHHLRGLGVGPERLVGMFLERSADIVVAILGILKAGGAYVPMDPVYPADRVRSIAVDAGIAALVSQESLLGRLPAVDVPLVVIDRDWDGIAAAPAVEGPGPSPENAAYVIYTSGSTGVPKGVMIPHYQVIRLFQATDSWFRFGPSDVWTLFHSYAFDFSVWELWGPLLHGGKVVVVPYLVSRSPEDFYRLLRDEQVTILNQTPSAFQQLSQAEGKLGAAPDLALRLVIFGGEALDFNTLAPWFERHGDQKPQLVNMYGITETTVHVTYRPVGLTDLEARSPSMIGEPIPDLELLILDERLGPVPVGVPGELFVGGAGVARGYLNRPELNALRFIAHPADAKRRLYRTGDLVRSHPNGDIEYLGRIDNQVQLRGFRVELGEVDSGLTELPGVLESITIIREDQPGDKRIVAYAVIGEKGPSLEGMREHLRQKLPTYMVPSAIVVLEHLPLTPNGKVNRAALPKPVTGSANIAPPRNPTEMALVDLWREVLEATSIGVRDNFFDVGGHSLMAVRLLSRVSAHFGRDVPLVALFQNPTIEGLARFLDEGQLEWSPLLPLQNRGDDAPFYCVPGSGGMVFAFRDLSRKVSGRPFVGVQRPGLDDGQEPLQTVREMADLAVAAIRQAQASGPYHLGGHSFGAWVAFEIAAQLSARGAAATLHVLDMPAPPPEPAGGGVDPEKVLDTLIEIVEAIYGREMAIDRDGLRGLGMDEQVEKLTEHLMQADILTSRTGIDQVRGMLAVLEADERALASYGSAGPESTFPITVLRTATGWDAGRSVSADAADPTLGWQRLSSLPVAVRQVRGDHSSMLVTPDVDDLAAALDASLAEVSGSPAPAESGS